MRKLFGLRKYGNIVLNRGMTTRAGTCGPGSATSSPARPTAGPGAIVAPGRGAQRRPALVLPAGLDLQVGRAGDERHGERGGDRVDRDLPPNTCTIAPVMSRTDQPDEHPHHTRRVCRNVAPPAQLLPCAVDVAAIIGVFERGPLDTPVRVASWPQVQATFGDFIPNGIGAYASRDGLTTGPRRLGRAGRRTVADDDPTGAQPADRQSSIVDDSPGWCQAPGRRSNRAMGQA